VILVVTGTDTGVGKTVVTAALAVALAAAGRRVAVLKPVQAGTEDDLGDDLGDGLGDGLGDADVVRRLAGVRAAEGIRLPDPMAPVAAAARAGVRLPGLAEHCAHVERLAADHDDVLVEGTGGLLVELDGSGGTVADLAGLTGASTVVVCRSGLGTLNHTALTLEALERRGVAVPGLVVGAWPRSPSEVERDNRARLARLAPLLGAVPAGAGQLPVAEFRRAAPGWFTGLPQAASTSARSSFGGRGP
jgi:dethiobiotin synthase